MCLERSISNGILSPNRIHNNVDTYFCEKRNITAIDMCSFRNKNCSHYKIIYPNFEFMYLNSNNVTELHEDLFISLPNIKKIDLHNNRITSISYYLFINNNKLLFINLYNNKIKTFIVELAHILSLRTVLLSRNPIETLHEGTLKYFFIRNTHMKKFMGIGFINNVKCDCNVNWIRRIKKEIKINDFEFGNRKYINLTEFLKVYENLEKKCTLNNNLDTYSIG